MASPKNIRRVPDWLLDKVKKLSPKPLIAGCVKKITAAELKAGRYKHIGLSWLNDKPQFPESIVPSAKNGHYSTKNANGYEVKRTDLPMVTKTVTINTPNFGDWSRGSHTVDFSREVYQR